MTALKQMEPVKQRYAYAPNYAVKPGETLCEVMESLGMTQSDLAMRTGLTEHAIVRMLSGEQQITVEVSDKLELATGVPARLWSNLETLYCKQLRKINHQPIHHQPKTPHVLQPHH